MFNRTPRSIVMFCVMLGLLASGLAFAADEVEELPGRVKPNPKRPTGKLPLISKITDDLSKEARVGWGENKKWPHVEADYSTRADTAMTNRQLIAALMKRQDSHPAVDGYVRWQLLSFVPDFTEAKPIELKRMIGTLPSLTRLPIPPEAKNVLDKGNGGGGGYFFSGTQRAFISDLRPVPGANLAAPTLSVLGGGSGLNLEKPEEVIEKSRGAAYDLVQSRGIIEKLNVPTYNFRVGLIHMLPNEGGIKLEALFEHMKDTIEAGDPHYKEACQDFYNEAFRTQADASVPEKTRYSLVQQVKALSPRTILVVVDVKIDNAGNMKVEREGVKFPKEHVPQLLAYLLGPLSEKE